MDSELFTIVAFWFDIFSLSIAVIAIIIVVWDHFKDDRVLTKQVQEFYDDIENLIFSYYKMAIVDRMYDSGGNSAFPIGKLDELHFKFRKERKIYEGFILQRIDDFSKYLGITDNLGKNEIINKTEFRLLARKGELRKDNWSKQAKSAHLGVIDNILDIKEEEIVLINKYLKSFRDYWDEKYNIKLFRKKLIPKVNFSVLITPEKFIK